LGCPNPFCASYTDECIKSRQGDEAHPDTLPGFLKKGKLIVILLVNLLSLAKYTNSMSFCQPSFEMKNLEQLTSESIMQAGDNMRAVFDKIEIRGIQREERSDKKEKAELSSR